MTDQTPDTEAADPAALQLRLHLAVDQLLQPATEQLDRDCPDPFAAPEPPDTEHQALTAAWARCTTTLTRLSGLPADAWPPDGPSAPARALRDSLAATYRTVQALTARIEARTRARAARTAPIAPLLDQLIDEIPASGGSGGAPSAGAHRSILALPAAELVADIERTVRWGRRAHSDGRPLATTLRDQIRAWATRSGHWRTTAPTYLLHATIRAETWVTTGRTLLNPIRRLTPRGACPACGRTIAHVRDDAGDTVRRPALEVVVGSDGRSYARCLSCGTHWPPERLQLLADVLEHQHLETP